MAGVTLLTEEEMYQPYEIAQKVNALIELVGRVGPVAGERVRRDLGVVTPL